MSTYFFIVSYFHYVYYMITKFRIARVLQSGSDSFPVRNFAHRTYLSVTSVENTEEDMSEQVSMHSYYPSYRK